MFLWLISWVAVVLQLAFFLLSLGGSTDKPRAESDLDRTTLSFLLSLSPAAGLYYLAELIEEYSVLAKKVIGFSVLVRPVTSPLPHVTKPALNTFTCLTLVAGLAKILKFPIP